jgi:hypothetical protein
MQLNAFSVVTSRTDIDFVTRSISVRDVTTEKALSCMLHNFLNNIDGLFQYPYVKIVIMTVGTSGSIGVPSPSAFFVYAIYSPS